MTSTILEAAALATPLPLFSQWFADAQADTRIAEPTAMCLATATQDATPSARIVLLKAHDEAGFVFFTHYESQKAQELQQNPQAALCFHWMPLERQVRITGAVHKLDADASDAYFASRPRSSRISARTSQQSKPLVDYQHFEEELAAEDARFAGQEIIPRPEAWGGFRLSPNRIEFWQQVTFRRHQRIAFTKQEDGHWKNGFLYP